MYATHVVHITNNVHLAHGAVEGHGAPGLAEASLANPLPEAVAPALLAEGGVLPHVGHREVVDGRQEGLPLAAGQLELRQLARDGLFL